MSEIFASTESVRSLFGKIERNTYYYIAKTERNMKGTSLGEFEELCLLAVAVLQDDAYGVSIKEEIDRRTRRNTTISTIHSTLIRLERKGFLKSKMGGATDERGGRAKRLFEITAFGKKAINEARILRNNMWKDIPDLLWKGGPL